MKDLWNLDNLKEEIKGAPNVVLKEQVEYFNETTEEIICARLIESDNEATFINDYEMITELVIIAPNLNGYRYRLLTVFSNLDPLFPVAVVANYNKDMPEILDKSEICNTYAEYEDKLEKIIGSKRTNQIVRTLYSKSTL